MADSILIYRIGFLGDTLVALPTFQEIKKTNPNSKIYLFTIGSPNFSSNILINILQRCIGLDGVITYKSGANISEIYSLIKEIKAQNFKKLYYLAPLRDKKNAVIRDYVFFKFLCGIKITFGFSKSHNSCSKISGNSISEYKRIFSVDPNLKIFDQNPFNNLKLDFENIKIDCLLQSNYSFQKNWKYIAICPGSKMPAKRWPVERYKELGNKIIENSNVILVLIGDLNDKIQCDYLKESWGERALNFAGKLTIFESVALLSRCILYIGNDTGAMHLASLCGVPCLSIFSARDLVGKWDPIGKNHVTLRAEIHCSNCMKEICPNDNACLMAISIDNVIEQYYKLAKLLKIN